MKKRFVKVLLIAAMLLTTAAPAQAFAAESNTLIFGALPQFQSVKISTIQLRQLIWQLSLKTGQLPSSPVTVSDITDPSSLPASASATSSAVTETTAAKLGAVEQQIIDLVNKERAAAGLPALKVNMTLVKIAELKAADLRDNNYFNHTSPTYGTPFEMMKQFGISYTAAGENIAKGQTSAEEVMRGWMNSPGHKANILSSKFTEIGVGYVAGSDGTGYWVQEFIRP